MQPVEIRARFRSKLIANCVAIPVITPAVIVLLRQLKSPAPGGIALYLSLSVVVAVAIFAWVTWRCPACQTGLGRAVYPEACPGCGAALR